MTEPTEWLEPLAVRAKLGVSRQRLQQLRKAKTLGSARYDNQRNVWLYSSVEVDAYLAWRQTYHPLTNYLPPAQQTPEGKPRTKHAPVVSPEELAAIDQWRQDAQAFLDNLPTGLEGLGDGDTKLE